MVTEQTIELRVKFVLHLFGGLSFYFSFTLMNKAEKEREREILVTSG